MRTVLLAATALLSWSVPAYAEDRAPDTTLTNTLTAPAASAAASRPMLSQSDPAWASLRFGTTTVQKSGCLIFALMDVLMQMGLVYTSPAAFISMLAENRLFTKSGSLSWSLSRLFPVTATRLSLSGEAAYAETVQLLSQGTNVLLQVATGHGTFHWIVASRVVGNDIEVRDPNGGRIGMLSSLYGVAALRGLAAISRS